jgi:hypothetical protein
MILKRGLVALVLLVYSCYSYTEIVNSKTANAAAQGLQWTMTNVLPQQAGLVVNGVNYRYTAVKDAQDSMVVNVQNSNAVGTGYIFRSRDDWTGVPGTTITKNVLVADIPIQYWGMGEINVQGRGQVTNSQVSYTYRYDTCFNNTTDPKCPGYKPPIPTTKTSDPLDDEFVKKSLDNKPRTESDEERERASRLLKKEQQEEKKKSAVASKAVQNSLVTAEAAAQAAAFESLNNISGFGTYSRTIPGGVYQETIKYTSKALADSKNSVRLNLSQQLLHTELTDLQYVVKPQGLQND